MFVGVIALLSAALLWPPYPGPQLAHVRSTPVYGTFLLSSAGPVCPRRARPLGKTDVSAAGRAVAAGMPKLYASYRGSPRLDARGARVTASVRATSPRAVGTAFRRSCGLQAWNRSVYVALALPKVRFSASLAQPSFLVARTARGWILWAEVH